MVAESKLQHAYNVSRIPDSRALTAHLLLAQRDFDAKFEENPTYLGVADDVCISECRHLAKYPSGLLLSMQ